MACLASRYSVQVIQTSRSGHYVVSCRCEHWTRFRRGCLHSDVHQTRKQCTFHGFRCVIEFRSEWHQVVQVYEARKHVLILREGMLSNQCQRMKSVRARLQVLLRVATSLRAMQCLTVHLSTHTVAPKLYSFCQRHVGIPHLDFDTSSEEKACLSAIGDICVYTGHLILSVSLPRPIQAHSSSCDPEVLETLRPLAWKTEHGTLCAE